MEGLEAPRIYDIEPITNLLSRARAPVGPSCVFISLLSFHFPLRRSTHMWFHVPMDIALVFFLYFFLSLHIPFFYPSCFDSFFFCLEFGLYTTLRTDIDTTDNSQCKWTHITYNYRRSNDVDIKANGYTEDQQCRLLLLLQYYATQRKLGLSFHARNSF